MSIGLDIIIVSFFSKSQIAQLVKSINNSALKDCQLQVIIVNNSPSESLKDIKCNHDILIIDNKLNKGFGFACNQAIPHCKFDYQLLLNPDTVLNPDTLYQSVLYLEQMPEVTVLGVKQLDVNGNINFSCSRFPTLRTYTYDILGLSKLSPKLFHPAYLMTDWDHRDSRYVDQVMGAYLLIRNSFIKQNGLMDERFFVFLEDADLCKRVWLSGGRVFYNSNITITHECGASTEGVSDKKTAYLMEGKLKYAHKYFAAYKYYLLIFLVIFIEPFTRVAFALISNPKNIKDILKGYALFIKRHQFK